MKINYHKLYRKDKWIALMLFPFVGINVNYFHNRIEWSIDIGIWLWNVEISWRRNKKTK